VKLSFKCIIAAVVISVLPLSSSSFAALIDNDWYTTDTDSGLDWLDMSPTIERSYLDISANFGVGGDFEGWRYASTLEVEGLVDAAGGDGNYYKWPFGNNPQQRQNQDVAVTDLLIKLLGYTWTHPETNTYIYSKTSDIYKGFSDRRWLHLFMSDYPSTDDGYVSLNSYYDYVSHNSINTGSFLVRNSVPEPSALALMALGLAGIGWKRRRAA